jgi:hypothetical protein
MSPNNMDSTAIDMEERVKIEDKVASAVLKTSPGIGFTPAESSRADDAQPVSSDAEVGFRFHGGEKRLTIK